jgi:hypothetical protein
MRLVPVVALVAASVAACAPRAAAPVDLPDPTQPEWTRLRAHLAISREAVPERPYVERITIAMREPRTGKVFQARGAVAVDPRRAMRMILVGPGGATAFDAWVTDTRYRLALPGIDLTRRGGADAQEARGLPVGFFRWWLLHPLDGRLLAAWPREGGPMYLLRRDGDTVLLREARVARGPSDGAEGGPFCAFPRRHVVAMRRGEGALDEIEWLGATPAMPHPGDKARYLDVASGLEIEVLVEAIGAEPPDPGAFADPDAPSGAEGSQGGPTGAPSGREL